MSDGDRDLRNRLDGLFSDLEDSIGVEEDKPASLKDTEENITPTAAVAERLFAEQADRRADGQLVMFRALAEKSADAITVGDLEGRQIYGNRACYELFGYDYESQEMLGQPLTNFWYEEDATILTEEVLPQSMAGGWSGEVRQRRKDGSLFQASLIMFPILDNAGQIISVAIIIRDITPTAAVARKRPEHQATGELERRARQVQTSTDVAQEIAAALALDELYRRVVTLVKERFGYYHAQLFLLNEEEDRLETVAGYGKVGRQLSEQGYFIPVGKGVVGRTGARGEPVLSPDVSQDPEWIYYPLLPDTQGELAVPVKLRGKVLGVLDVQSDTVGALTEEDQVMLVGLAGQIATAIESARLLEQMQARTEGLAVLEEMGRALTAILEVDAVIENIYRYTSRLMDTTNLYVALYDPQHDQVSFPLYAEGEQVRRAGSRPAGKGLTEYVIRTREPLLIEENVPARIEELGCDLIGEPAESWLGVPMIIGEQVIGVIAVQSYTTSRAYDEHHRDLLNTIAGQAAIAIENARLFDEHQQARFLLSARVEELDCLNDISRKIDETPPVPEFLQWVAERIPSAMQYPAPPSEGGVCLVAIEFEDADRGGRTVYGAAEAIELPCQIVGGLRIGGERVGQVYISYTEEHRFLDEEADRSGRRALLGDIVRRVSGYIENRRLFEQVQAALEEAEAAHRLYVHKQWTEFVPARAAPFYECTRPGVTPLGDPTSSQNSSETLASSVEADQVVLSRVIEQAMTQREVVVQSTMGDEATQAALVAPIMLRGEVIGALGMHEIEGGRRWTDDEITLIRDVADQIALAIENARLLADTRRRAEREQIITDISARVRSSMNLETILQTAVRELGAALGTDRAFIRLGADTADRSGRAPCEE